MTQQTINAHRGYRERAMRRRKARERQVLSSLKEANEMNTNDSYPSTKTPFYLRAWFLILVAAFLLLCCCPTVIGLGYLTLRNRNAAAAKAEATPTPIARPTDRVCTTCPNVYPAPGQIYKPKAFETDTINGVEYGNDFSDRLTFTNGEILCGHLPPYAGADLEKIQTTWVKYDLEMPENAAFAVAFGFSIKFDGQVYTPGAIVMLPVNQGKVSVEILDGELILWRDLSAMHRDISDRISAEIKNGNLSIHGPLAFSYVSQEFVGYVPQELLEARKVQIIEYDK